MQTNHLSESGSVNHGEYLTHVYFLHKMVSSKILVHTAYYDDKANKNVLDDLYRKGTATPFRTSYMHGLFVCIDIPASKKISVANRTLEVLRVPPESNARFLHVCCECSTWHACHTRAWHEKATY